MVKKNYTLQSFLYKRMLAYELYFFASSYELLLSAISELELQNNSCPSLGVDFLRKQDFRDTISLFNHAGWLSFYYIHDFFPAQVADIPSSAIHQQRAKFSRCHELPVLSFCHRNFRQDILMMISAPGL